MRSVPILLVALLSLAGCQTRSAAPVKVAASIPYSLKAPCKSPETIPDGDLTYDASLVLWASDRAALDGCGIRHKALAAATDALEK
jgi:hypothetical protein